MKTWYKRLDKVICATVMTGQKFEELAIRERFSKILVWYFVFLPHSRGMGCRSMGSFMFGIACYKLKAINW